MGSLGSVLFVVTSHSTLDAEGKKTGLWLEELAPPYYLFTEAGFDVDIVSVCGGIAPVDPLSITEPWVSDYGRRFMANESVQHLLCNTLSLEDVKSDNYEVIFLVGGAGAAWDFSNNKILGALLSSILDSEGLVTGICHGVCGLLNPVNGVPLARDRKLTCVSNAEEKAAGFDQVVPLLPEHALVHAGAKIKCAEPFESNVVEDGNIMTGQNPASAVPLAVAILNRLTAT